MSQQMRRRELIRIVGAGAGTLTLTKEATAQENLGTERWQFTPGGAVASPTVADGTVYVGSADSNLYAVDAQTGTEQWRFQVGGVASPTVADGTVYVGSADSKLYAVDAQTGTEQWRFRQAGEKWHRQR